MTDANIIMIPVGNLESDENYQRKINKSHVKNIINNFDWRKVDVIKVSHRDGRYFIYDGQHTAAAILAKFGKDRLVACNVQEGLAWTDEAKLFVEQDCGVVKVSCADKFRANYRRGDAEATDIVTICEKYGISVMADSPCRSTFKTAAVNTLIKYYERLGKDLFEESVSLVSAVWSGISESMSRKVLTATFMFVQAYHGLYKRAQAVKKWKSIPVNEIISFGDSQINNGSTKYARALLQLYNKGLPVAERLADKL